MTEEEIGGGNGIEASRLQGLYDVGTRKAHVHHDLDAHLIVEIRLWLNVGRQGGILVTHVYPLILHHRLQRETRIRKDYESSVGVDLGVC